MTAPTTEHGMLAAALRPLIPADWQLIGYDDNADEPTRTRVAIAIQEVARAEFAPAGAYAVTWIVTVTTPYTDPSRADADVFESLLQLLAQLDDPENGLSWMGWKKATRVLDQAHLAYDIEILTETKKKEA